MGKSLLIFRLAGRDLRRRPAQAILLLLAITAATTTLTLGLALHGVTSHPYQQTRTATAGPDIVASVFPPRPNRPPADLAGLHALAQAPGVTGHTGPYPVTWALLRARSREAAVMAEGRDRPVASIDQPKLTAGGWVRSGGVVIERSFADALRVRPGDRVTLNGRPFTVAGVAVAAAIPAYPQVCFAGCILGRQLSAFNPGLIWLTQPDARRLATPAEPLSYFMNLKLADPARAGAFASAHGTSDPGGPFLMSWQSIRDQDALLVTNVQTILLTGSWLLGLLAAASVTVLVGGRMAEQTRRVGLLKAVGGTPGLVAAVLLAEHLGLALIAAAAGLAAGQLTAPLLASPGAGLVGAPGAPPITPASIGLVLAAAVAVAAAATLVPAIRAARTSTVRALADSARPPRRSAAVIAISARLPVSLLLGLRIAARRPRRTVLNVVSVAVTVSGIVAVLVVHAVSDWQLGGSSGLSNPQTDRLNQVTLVLSVMLVVLAAVNAIFITWATVLDARRSSALERALGATPRQASAGLSAALLLPALAGAILGVPGGIALFTVANPSGPTTIPPAWWLLTAVLGSLLVLAGLTAVPAGIGARRPVAEILQSELA